MPLGKIKDFVFLLEAKRFVARYSHQNLHSTSVRNLLTSLDVIGSNARHTECLVMFNSSPRVAILLERLLRATFDPRGSVNIARGGESLGTRLAIPIMARGGDRGPGELRETFS